MENQAESNACNKRWQAQLVEWQLERLQLLYEADVLKLRAEGLMRLIELAKSQITPEPPARAGWLLGVKHWTNAEWDWIPTNFV